MTNWTVGSGGTYTTWGAALAALAVASPLADDYDISQISDVVEVNTSHLIDLNGFTVTIRNASPHGGDPNVGHKITRTGTLPKVVQVNLSGAGTLEVKDLNIQFDTAGAGVFITGTDCTVRVHDIISTNTATAGNGVYVNSTTGDVKVWNCAISGFGEGLGGIVTGAGTATMVFENCTSIGAGGTGRGFVFSLGATGVATVRNVVAQGSVADFSNIGTCSGFNNASVDATAANGNWGTGSGNQTGITLANEFVSTTPSSSDFAQVKNDGGGVCFDGGTTPALVENTAGIRGDQRPQGNGDISIGADELETPASGGGTGSGGGLSGAIVAAMAMGY